MIRKKGIVLVTCSTVCLMVLILSPHIQGDKAEGWRKWHRLDGAWLRTTVQGGEPGASQMIVITPKDVFGRRAAFRGTFLNPDYDLTLKELGGTVTDYIGEGVMTGPSTYEATAYAYVMVPNPDPEGSRDVLSLIFVATASGTFVNENLVEGTYVGYLYLPSQDTNGDLIPDVEPPAITIPPGTFVDMRTPMVP